MKAFWLPASDLGLIGRLATAIWKPRRSMACDEDRYRILNGRAKVPSIARWPIPYRVLA